MKKGFMVPVITTLMALNIGSATVSAKGYTKYPAGGRWNYGTGVTGSYSDYYHAKKTHSASVVKGAKMDKARAGKGAWAKSRLTIYSGCSFYYDV